MNPFDQKRFYKEFPFLRYLNREPEYCENIVVQRSSSELLHCTPKQCKIVGPQVDFAQGDEVILFSQAGQPLGLVRAEVTQRCQQQGEAPLRPGESILEAIYRLNLINQVHYVVWVEYGQHSGPEWAVTIYKPSKDLSIEELVVKAEGKSATRVRAQIDF